MNKIRYILDLSNVTPPDDLPRKLMLLHDEARTTTLTGRTAPSYLRAMRRTRLLPTLTKTTRLTRRSEP